MTFEVHTIFICPNILLLLMFFNHHLRMYKLFSVRQPYKKGGALAFTVAPGKQTLSEPCFMKTVGSREEDRL